MNTDELTIFRQIKRGNIRSFNYLFNKYYEILFRFALTYQNQREVAEEIVQDIFMHIWEKRLELNISSSVRSYLFTSVKNRCISFLRRKFDKAEVVSYGCTPDEQTFFQSPDIALESIELEFHIKNAIKMLPDRCRIIFNLSRNTGLTYREIAAELGISTETVKTQISIALGKIKLHLERYWYTVPF